MRDGIDWKDVGSGGRFELICSVLLSTLHPGSQRIDGSGGDGGRDHQFYVDEKLEVWQAKYFLGRLNEGGRKAQVTKSLVAVAALQPDRWTLVTPMVPTPEERRWLSSQQALYPFPLEWQGGDWLDAHLAEHPSIVRHFMGPNDQYVALLRELQQGQEALVDGLPGASERLKRLSAAIDAADPFYKVSFTMADGEITNTSLRPKYPGAEHDSPVKIEFSVVVGPAPADTSIGEALRAALDWGEEAVLPSSSIRNFRVAAPHGLGRDPEERSEVTIRIGPAEVAAVDHNLHMVAWSPEGGRLAMLPARLTRQFSGQRGTTLEGADHSGVIRAKLRLDATESQVHLTLSFGPWTPLLPGAMIPVLHFMRNAVAPNRISFELGDGKYEDAVPLPPGGDSDLNGLITFVEGLERLQRASSVLFPVPEQYTAGELREVRRGIRLLDGERVRVGSGPVTFEMEGDQLAGFLGACSEGQHIAVALDSEKPYTVHINGHEMDIGPCTYYVQSVKPVARPPVGGDSGVVVVLQPDDGYGVEVALGRLTQQPGQPAADPTS